MDGKANAVKVGVTVIVTLVLVAAAISVINSEFFSRGRSYYLLARFTGNSIPDEGMKISFRGVEIGWVEKVVPNLGEEYLDYTEVKVRVRKTVRSGIPVVLFNTDKLVLSQKGILGEKQLTIERKEAEDRSKLEQGDVIIGYAKPGLEEFITNAGTMIEDISELMGEDQIGGLMKGLSDNLDTTLDSVEQLLTNINKFIAGSEGGVNATLANVQAISQHFLQVSRDMEETSARFKRIAADPKYEQSMGVMLANMESTSTSLSNISAQLDGFISDPALQQDAKDSVRLTKETLQEAKTTMQRFQQSMDKVDGMLESADGLMGEASGAITDVKSKVNEISRVGDAVDVRLGMNIRAVDLDDSRSLNNDDIYVGDINAAIAYENTYVYAGADNIGEDNNANFMLGYGPLTGLSFRGGVYRSELGIGAAYYFQGGGGAEFMMYDTEDPKMNSYGFIPVGDKVNVVVGIEDIENDPQASVGLGVEF